MKNFLKKHSLILLAAALPLFVILFFLVATELPSVITDPPRHSFLFYVHEYSNNPSPEVRLYVEDRRLKSEYKQHEKRSNHSHRTVSRLFLYDVKRQSAREIALAPKVSSKAEPDVWQSFEIEELKELLIDTHSVSPDGYTFDHDYGGSGGLLPELFIGSRRRHQLVLRKKGTKLKILPIERYYSSYNAKFLGWIEEKQ